MIALYNPKSSKAEEFINHEEILATLSYADENKHNAALIKEILAKAKLEKGLSHREASVLLACDIPELNEEIFHLAKKIKDDFYGDRIVLFAPLYLSNYCVNGCVYCPYHAKNKHIPRKKLGQNFLVDSNIVRKSLELADVNPNDCIVEIGPGLGTLTGALISRGARVWAVEIDPELYAYLRDTFRDEENLNLINADALEFPLAGLPPDVPDFKIVANLPYAISTPWLDAVLSGKLPSKMSLMLQKEAALRFSAKNSSGEYSPISIFLSEAYDVGQPHKVSAACFFPRPGVDSMLLPLLIKKEPHVYCPAAKSLIRKIFSFRRKQLGSIAKSEGSGDISEWIDAAGIDPRLRPEAVGVQQWRLLDKILSQR